jgi:endoglucanase
MRSSIQQLPGLLIVLLLCSCMIVRAQTNQFKKGDKICFVGNSITTQGGFHHNIALYYATRFPGEPIEVINCGIPGDMAANVIARLDSDVLIHHPTWAVMMLGMNDVRKDLYTKEATAKADNQQQRQQALDVYKKNYETIIQSVLKSSCKVMLQTPSIYDQTAVLTDVALVGRNDALKLCAGYVKAFGEQYKLPVVDYWTVLNTATQVVQAKDPAATIIGPDRVHPIGTGHFVMAYEFLKTTVGPGVVSTVTIDASVKSGAPSCVNAKMNGFMALDKGWQFTVTENALPFPVPADAVKALELVPFVNDFNQEAVIIKKLAPGNYKLWIDDKAIGTYADNAFAAGINIAQNTNAPQYVQAQKVASLFRQYWQLEGQYRSLRGIEFGRLRAKKIITLEDAEKYFDNQVKTITDTASVAYKDLQGYLKTYLPNKRKEKEILEKMNQLHSAIYEASQPQPHLYKLIKE